jgi:hypothetical protein
MLLKLEKPEIEININEYHMEQIALDYAKIAAEENDLYISHNYFWKQQGDPLDVVLQWTKCTLETITLKRLNIYKEMMEIYSDDPEFNQSRMDVIAALRKLADDLEAIKFDE